MFHCEMVAAPPASSRSRLVTGELHVTWKSRFGSKRYCPM
jgi:hypothetical protein